MHAVADIHGDLQRQEGLLGIIGCGKIGYSSMLNISELGCYEVTALCDRDKDAVETFLQSFDYDEKPFVTNDYRALLERKEVDAVLISTPTYTHVMIAVEALRLGKDIMLEKPVGLNLEEVDRLISAAGKSDRIIDISLPYRNSHMFNTVMNLAKGEYLNDTKFAVFNEHRYNFLRPWFYDEKKSGGAINDKMIHYFNLANELFYPSMPLRVYASGSQHKNSKNFEIRGATGERYTIPESTIVDNASITAEYEDDRLAVFTLNMYQKYPIEQNKISVTALRKTGSSTFSG